MISRRTKGLGLALIVGLLGSTNAMAKDPIDVSNIRQVQTSSTDVFEVLATLSVAQSDLASRDYVAASRGFETVLFHDPSQKVARVGMRRSLMALGHFKDAANYVDDNSSPDSVLIAVQLGAADDPLGLILETLKTNSDPRLWTLLGQLQDSAGQPETARQSYAMAGIAGARAGLAENNIGQSHWLVGEYDLALNAFDKAVVADPSDIQFDNNRRRVLIKLGQLHEAILGLNSNRAGVFLEQAGDQAIEENETQLAYYLYRKSLDISPRHNPQTAIKLARLEK